MSNPQWSLQDAKNKFSAVVEAALEGTPQTVTRRGVPAVVVVAAAEYERLRRLQRLEAPSFAQHLLNMPKGDVDFEPMDVNLDVNLRDVDF